MASKPIIGICCRMDIDGDQFYLRKQYSEAVYHAGGIPVLLPLISDPEYSNSLLERLDGILLSGSNSDVDPHRYKEDPIPQIGSIMTRRDQTDWNLLEEVFRKKVPLLGICFGMQILNVFLGGSLWQDIPTQIGQALKHSQRGLDEYKSHTIKIKPHSLLHRLAGQDEAKVNSFHHQGVKSVASNLECVAEAGDGVIEALELKEEDHFVLAVQWHPEIGWNQDPLSQRIFSEFVSAASGVRR
ncbi:MAG: gamma-glutamyl-gamma-aminobutyrate hydrolase family protein [Acidobacteriota bacterium]